MINNINYSIYFGDSSSSLFQGKELEDLILNDKNTLREKIGHKTQSKTYFNHQIHSSQGTILTAENALPFENQGDFIITGLKNIAIGILTADCLPIVFYDEANNIAAIAHAGWKGTIKNIAQITFENMKNNFNSIASNIQIFFGPSAKVCCYEVNETFKDNLKSGIANTTLVKKNNKYFFDLPSYNRLLLEECGIKSFNTEYNICTICNANFCSARREKELSGRQISTILLKL